jgi:membrane-bound serine protease (ClpP class)
MRKVVASVLGILLALGAIRPIFAQGVTTVAAQDSIVDQFTAALTNPILISLLLVLGILALLAEISAPGGFVSGLVGVIMIGLALYGLSQISANWLGLALVVLAFVLFIAELKTPTMGILGIVGAVLLFGGLLVLFNTGSGEYIAQLSLLAAALIAVPTFVLVAVITRAAAQARLKTPITGREQLIGSKGVARGDFRPHHNAFEGNVFVMGEIWKARSAEPVRSDDQLSVEAIDGLTLQVLPFALAAKEADPVEKGAKLTP